MNKIKPVFRWIIAKRSRVILITLAVLAIIIFSITRNRQNDDVQYKTATAERGNIVSTVSASGSVLSSNYTNVTTSATGIVAKIYVQDGEQVTKGQKIMEIELDSAGQQKNASNYAAYLSAKNAVDSANTSLYTLQSASFAANQKFINDAVARELVEDDPTYIQQYADWKAAEAKYNQQSQVIAQSKVALSNSYLSYLGSSSTVVSPSTGTLANLTYAPGMTLSGSDSSSSASRVAIIKSEGNPLISVNVSEIDVPSINVGMRATVTVDSLSEKSFTGKVVSVDKIGSSTSGVTNYPVVIALDTNADAILPNMSVTANIILDSKSDVLLIPSSAVTTSNNQSTVRVQNNGQINIVNVETGLSSEAGVEIKSGLSEGDTVITGTATTDASSSGSRSVFSTSGFGGAFRSSGGAPR